jgi:hypothetical protein
VDLYHIWCNLEPGSSDLEFCEAVDRYLGALRAVGRIAGHRISRRKLGLGPRELGEFHVVIEFEDLAQLDHAFREVSTRHGPIEALHHAVNQHARDLTFALYRDFPDGHRQRGGERF